MGNSESSVPLAEVVQRLQKDDVLPSDAEVWSPLLGSPLVVEDIFEVITPQAVRELKRRKPQNLAVLLSKVVETMGAVCERNDRGSGVLLAEDHAAAINCVRLLTRIMPFLLEDPEDEVVEEILWGSGRCSVPEAPGVTSTDAGSPATAPARVEGGVGGQSAQEDSLARSILAEAAAAGEAAAAASAASEEPAATGQDALANEVLHHLMRFLFLPDFTVRRTPPRGEILPTRFADPTLVWRMGVGITDEVPPPAPTLAHCRARLEVLRCLLTCLSGPLFQSADDAGYQQCSSRWLAEFTGGEVCHTANLFCSLFSTIFQYDPVGWGVPYGSVLSAGSEEDLVDVALQVVCVLMDYRPRMDLEDEQSAQRRNVYHFMLQNIKKDSEIDLIFSGIVRLLETTHQAVTTYLPNSRRSVDFYQEALVLLWHLVTMNPTFKRRVVDHLDTNMILLPVLYLLHQAQKTPAQLAGLLHVTSFILLVFSSERSFAVRLNEPYVSNLPLDIPIFSGNHADLLFLSLHQVVSDSLSKPQHDALVEMLHTVMCNISPYVKSFCAESCLKLLGLVDRCSKTSYLCRSAFTHRNLAFLLEVLNNIIQYQFEGNAMMVYSILRHKETFTRISALELPERFRVAASSKAEYLGTADDGDAEVTTAAVASEVIEAKAVDASANGGAAATGAEAVAAGMKAVMAEAKWIPTEAWLDDWKKDVHMPMQSINCLIDNLSTEIESYCKETEAVGQDQVAAYLRRTTLVGILPVPHPIVVRTYQMSNYTSMWFTSYLWGLVFTRSQGLPLYDWQKIRLITINQ